MAGTQRRREINWLSQPPRKGHHFRRCIGQLNRLWCQTEYQVAPPAVETFVIVATYPYVEAYLLSSSARAVNLPLYDDVIQFNFTYAESRCRDQGIEGESASKPVDEAEVFEETIVLLVHKLEVCQRCRNKGLNWLILDEFSGALKHRHLPLQSHLHTAINLNQGESMAVLSSTIWVKPQKSFLQLVRKEMGLWLVQSRRLEIV